MSSDPGERSAPLRRVFVVVLDAVGVGAMPDAADFGEEDPRANTLANTAKAVGGLSLPNLWRWGLGNLTEIEGVPPNDRPDAAFGRCALAAPNKDTVSGHWEMMGYVLDRRLPVYPNGFSEEILRKICEVTGEEGWLGNKAASGTVILDELGEEHIRTKKPIVYTSADSVFQVAAHEEYFGLDRLYAFCEAARKILVGEDEVARVIARPFVGEKSGGFQRTAHRRDYAIAPGETVLDRLTAAGVTVHAIGKISDIFLGRGVTKSEKTASNARGIVRILHALENGDGFVFANLVDFDQEYGHRNDPKGFARALEEFDRNLPWIEKRMREGDLVILVSDHGNDPTTSSTDHSREYAMLLAKTAGGRAADLGTRRSLADVGATVLASFGLPPMAKGESFLEEILPPRR